MGNTVYNLCTRTVIHVTLCVFFSSMTTTIFLTYLSFARGGYWWEGLVEEVFIAVYFTVNKIAISLNIHER